MHKPIFVVHSCQENVLKGSRAAGTMQEMDSFAYMHTHSFLQAVNGACFNACTRPQPSILPCRDGGTVRVYKLSTAARLANSVTSGLPSNKMSTIDPADSATA